MNIGNAKKILYFALAISALQAKNINPQGNSSPTIQLKIIPLNYGAHLVAGGLSYIPLMAGIAAYSKLGFLAGLYILYKTPQWTDTHILKKTEKRTAEQNLITLLSRACLSYPLGILAGEFFSQNNEIVIASSP